MNAWKAPANLWALAAAAVILAGCAPAGERAPAEGVPVAASFYPLFAFAQRVGGTRVTVSTLVPAGADAHDYEPSARDIVDLHRVRVLIYNGAGFEPWIQRVAAQLPPEVVRINATAGLEVKEPHVWLDPVLAQHQAARILEGLSIADPSRAPEYRRNAAALRADLQALHERFRRGLARCAQREVVTSHAAFGHLARRYGLRLIPLSGGSDEEEPSPRRLVEVIAFARARGVRLIYIDGHQARVADTVAREAGAQTRRLNPLESLTRAEHDAGDDYFTIMEKNLHALTAGLGCG